MQRIELTVDGMTCEHCQRAVTQALSQVPGVESAQVDLQAGHASVAGHPEVQALLDAIQEEGYRAQLVHSPGGPA